MNEVRRSIETLYYFWEDYHDSRSVAISITAVCLSCVFAIMLSVLTNLIFNQPFFVEFFVVSVALSHPIGFLYFYPQKRYKLILERMEEENTDSKRFKAVNMLKSFACFALIMLYVILLNPDKF